MLLLLLVPESRAPPLCSTSLSCTGLFLDAVYYLDYFSIELCLMHDFYLKFLLAKNFARQTECMLGKKMRWDGWSQSAVTPFNAINSKRTLCVTASHS